jgi:hypothetical protein
MKKKYDAIATCFDFNDNGNDGPYALFSVGDKNMRVVVHMSAEELRAVIGMGRCTLMIQIEQLDQPNAKDHRAGPDDQGKQNQAMWPAPVERLDGCRTKDEA